MHEEVAAANSRKKWPTWLWLKGETVTQRGVSDRHFVDSVLNSSEGPKCGHLHPRFNGSFTSQVRLLLEHVGFDKA